jgi:hypothetical protein
MLLPTPQGTFCAAQTDPNGFLRHSMSAVCRGCWGAAQSVAAFVSAVLLQVGSGGSAASVLLDA